MDGTGLETGLVMSNYCIDGDMRRVDTSNARLSLESNFDLRDDEMHRNRPSTSTGEKYYGPGIDETRKV